MKISKKTLSVLLCAFLLLGTVAVGSTVAFADGEVPVYYYCKAVSRI